LDEVHVQWSGRGADGGRDLICTESLRGLFEIQKKTWLVQCKHFAHSGASVGIRDLDSIIDSCRQHNATGYLLCCSTQPSSAVVQRLEAISADGNSQVTALFWDAVILERLLSTPQQWGIVQRLMPISGGAWRLYATDNTNDFIAHHRGYVFHLTNRIGSDVEHHLPTVAARIVDIEALGLPEGHHIRPRAIWYDDKHGVYKWYIDYLYPSNQHRKISAGALKYALQDGWVWEDGQTYFWDIKIFQYNENSDHYDRDHYDYYFENLPLFREGRERQETWEQKYVTRQDVEDLESEREKIRHPSFDRMLRAFAQLPFLSVIWGCNVQVEEIRKFERRFVWSSIMQSDNVSVDHMFNASILITVLDKQKFFRLMKEVPQLVEKHFRVSKRFTFLPDTGLSEDDDDIYEITFDLHPILLESEHSIRREFNGYFEQIEIALNAYVNSGNF
jgi:hypothetical protein